MKIDIVGIEGVGDLAKERIVLKVTEDTDLGDYAVLRSQTMPKNTVASGAITGGTYWFNAKEVKADDYVILYTKSGSASQKDIGEERTSYFFYWGFGAPIWTAPNTPVLLEAPEWAIVEANAATEEPEPPKQNTQPKSA